MPAGARSATSGSGSVVDALSVAKRNAPRQMTGKPVPMGTRFIGGGGRPCRPCVRRRIRDAIAELSSAQIVKKFGARAGGRRRQHGGHPAKALYTCVAEYDTRCLRDRREPPVALRHSVAPPQRCATAGDNCGLFDPPITRTLMARLFQVRAPSARHLHSPGAGLN